MSETPLDMLDLPQQELQMPDMNREPVVVPLVFNADLNTETVSNVLLNTCTNTLPETPLLFRLRLKSLQDLKLLGELAAVESMV